MAHCGKRVAGLAFRCTPALNHTGSEQNIEVAACGQTLVVLPPIPRLVLELGKSTLQRFHAQAPLLARSTQLLRRFEPNSEYNRWGSLHLTSYALSASHECRRSPIHISIRMIFFDSCAAAFARISHFRDWRCAGAFCADRKPLWYTLPSRYCRHGRKSSMPRTP